MKTTLRTDLCKYRELAGLTQEQLARAVMVSRQTIIAIEKGNYSPSVYLALRIAAAIDVPITKIFYIS
jgi:putative transcriptional regulator